MNAAPRYIAGDEYVVSAVLHADDPEHKIGVLVTRQGWPDDEPLEFNFALHPDRAVKLAHRLLTLAVAAETETITMTDTWERLDCEMCGRQIRPGETYLIGNETGILMCMSCPSPVDGEDVQVCRVQS